MRARMSRAQSRFAGEGGVGVGRRCGSRALRRARSRTRAARTPRSRRTARRRRRPSSARSARAERRRRRRRSGARDADHGLRRAAGASAGIRAQPRLRRGVRRAVRSARRSCVRFGGRSCSVGPSGGCGAVERGEEAVPLALEQRGLVGRARTPPRGSCRSTRSLRGGGRGSDRDVELVGAHDGHVEQHVADVAARRPRPGPGPCRGASRTRRASRTPRSPASSQA